jgi:ABC-type branched-subunit amino acid transport system substrate-binding protein
MTVCSVRLLVVVGLLAAATPAVHAEVLIGLAVPLTGHMAWAGGSDQVGAESAVADLNVMGGVLGERIEEAAAKD